MIEINLLPEENRKKKHPAHRIDIAVAGAPGLSIVSIAVRAAVLILVIQLIIFAVDMISGANYKSLKLKYQDILPKKQETEKLKIRVDTTNKKVAAIDELMVKRFSWEKKLNSLSDSMTPGIWLTDLEYNEKKPEAFKKPVKAPSGKKAPDKTEKIELPRYLILSGAASSMGEEGTALIGHFIRGLKDDPAFYSDFSDIELGTIRREKMDDQEIMTFKITCLFKAGR